MRVLEEKMLEAVKNFRSATCGSNTRVEVVDDELFVYLHGNLIFKQAKGDLPRFSDAGWHSNTTKSRLNVLLVHFGYNPIRQKDFVWYWDELLEGQHQQRGYSSVSWYIAR